MAQNETDEAGANPAATSTTIGADALGVADGRDLQWTKEKVAEDELSVLWKSTAEIETSEQLADATRQSNSDDFWPFIEDLANKCDEILAEHDLPSGGTMVRHDWEGNWWLDPKDAPERVPPVETWPSIGGEAFVEEFAPDFSDPWYAGRIGFKCRMALEHNRKGNAGEPFLLKQVFEIATLRKDWLWRRKQKSSILTGRKQRKVLDAYRSEANSKKRHKANTRREEISRLLLGTNLNGGAREKYLKKKLKSEAEIEVSLRTIRRDLEFLSKS